MRLNFASGKRAITRGPFGGSEQLLAGFALIKARSMDAAIEWASRLAAALDRDLEIEIGPVCEPWDLGMGPKPAEDVPIRFLILHKGDRACETAPRRALAWPRHSPLSRRKWPRLPSL